jgi:hypothetical protein
MVRAAGTTAAPGSLESLPDPTWRLTLGRGLPQFAGEAVGPVLVFYAAWKLGGLTAGIVASAVLSLSLALWLVRRGKDTALVALGALVVAIQAAVGLSSHHATLYLAQPVVLSGLWGIAYFGSVAIGRPLIGIFATAWYPFPDWFRASPAYRREFALQSLVWGSYCLARAGLRLWALLDSGVGSFVLISVATGAPVAVLLVAWGFWHARRSFTRLSAGDFATT